ncbi:glycosyltransferase family 4 protein [Bordetella bronchialis]|uniref:Transferase n=1 Tax=Bordetella bronchialis TaxID=463025 RepID=A0A193G2Z5_9BORD|nr:glycosyltransferase family 4 protein [Bordetella bronchialis]ANN73589.1 transferase [Bordetella bronchialis]
MPSPSPTRPLRILTWHVHGNYLYALTRVPHEFVIPVREGNPPGYGALGHRIPWGSRVREIPAQALRDADFDCIVYQSRRTYEEREQLLTPRQLALPCAYIEHDPPMAHPTDTAHWFTHERGILVHVTHYNRAAWDNGAMRTAVIEHGVPAPGRVPAASILPRGIAVINHLKRRGRRMGADLFEQAREQVPLDLIGMDAEAMGGLGEVSNMEVAAFVARYRFFYSPIRYTSLGLALIEAMMAGVPVVGFAATELARVIVNGRNGYIDTDPDRLIAVMKTLIDDPRLAASWGAQARKTALERYGMDRFVADWTRLFDRLMGDEQ